MARYRPHILFVLIMLTYAMIRSYRTSDFNTSEWISAYGTDVLFVPAMCLFALILLRRIRKDYFLIIPWYFVMIQTAMISFYFEWYLPNFPLFGHTYTSDIWDVAAYSIGALVYMFVQSFFLGPKNKSAV